MKPAEDKITVSQINGAQLSDHAAQITASASADIATSRAVSSEHARIRQSARWKNKLHPSGLRRFTARRVAHLLMRSDTLSRYELSQRAGLSLTAVGKIINSLEAAQVVEKVKLREEDGVTGPTLGRPSEYFRIARQRVCYLVVELGVNSTIVAGLPIAGPVGNVQTAKFRTPNDLAIFEQRLLVAIQALGIKNPSAILVSVPGVVDEDHLNVLYSPNLHWTEGAQLFETIQRVQAGQLVVVQEIRALAMGYLLHSVPNDSFLLVDTGDGVGSAMVIEGHLQYGPLPLSAEIGHTPILGNRRRCGCGSVGCLETLLGRQGLLKSARQHKRPDVRSWDKLVEWLASEPLPEWLEQTLDHTARVIAGALNSMGVSKVVLVGDLPALHPEIVERLSAGVNQHVLWGRFGKISVIAAARQRLFGLSMAALDRVILAPSPTEEALGLELRNLHVC